MQILGDLQAGLRLTQNAVALALASLGAGSMVAALVLPRLLETLVDRSVMLGGVGVMVAGMFVGTLVVGHASLAALGFALGLGYSAAQTPSGRLSRRSAHPEDRPALFAAQFALSHACWLLFYPLAGWLGVRYGMPVTFAVLGCAGALGLCITSMVGPHKTLKWLSTNTRNCQPGKPTPKEQSPRAMECVMHILS